MIKLQIVHNSSLLYVWILEHTTFELLYHFIFKKLVFWYYLSFTWNGLDPVFILTPSYVTFLEAFLISHLMSGEVELKLSIGENFTTSPLCLTPLIDCFKSCTDVFPLI